MSRCFCSILSETTVALAGCADQLQLVKLLIKQWTRIRISHGFSRPLQLSETQMWSRLVALSNSLSAWHLSEYILARALLQTQERFRQKNLVSRFMWVAVGWVGSFSLVSSVYTRYLLPLLNFRPRKVGTNPHNQQNPHDLSIMLVSASSGAAPCPTDRPLGGNRQQWCLHFG